MPITLIETMATGLPIVATSVGGVVDMIEHEKQGLLCRDDVDDISDSIIRMLSDKELREVCGRGAREKSECYSAESMTDGYLEIYSKVVK